jgi:hypothetical protein
VRITDDRHAALFGLKLAVVFGAMLLLGLFCEAQDQPYYPGVWGDWQARDPAEAGMNGDKLAAAVEFAAAVAQPQGGS